MSPSLSRLSVLHVNSPVESELRGLNFIGAAKKATDAAEMLPFGAKDAVAKAMSFAENNVNAAFDLAQKLVRAKDVSEVLALQSEFSQSRKWWRFRRRRRSLARLHRTLSPRLPESNSGHFRWA
jgi:Phasin protein